MIDPVTSQLKDRPKTVMAGGSQIEFDRKIRLGIPELWFHKDGIGKTSVAELTAVSPGELSLPAMVLKAVNKVGYGYDKMLLPNIHISGGCSQFDGFSIRLQNELQKLGNESGLKQEDVNSIHVEMDQDAQ